MDMDVDMEMEMDNLDMFRNHFETNKVDDMSPENGKNDDGEETRVGELFKAGIKEEPASPLSALEGDSPQRSHAHEHDQQHEHASGHGQENENENESEHENDNRIFNFGFETESYHPTNESVAPVGLEPVDDSAIDFESSIIYICPACGYEFNTQSGWKRHINRTHEFNTRRGLNFRKIDRLYHECLQCHRKIAMHAMENLLKHKFTHLPYRCSKCSICLRQYRYRQDLMIHLRTVHRQYLIDKQRSLNNNALETNGDSDAEAVDADSESRPYLEMIKQHSIEIVDDANGTVAIKCEPIDVEDSLLEESIPNNELSTDFHFLEDSQSKSSDQTFIDAVGPEPEEKQIYEAYIIYHCPKCAEQFQTQRSWRTHVDTVHDYNTSKGLNFKEIHKNLSARCLECKNIIYVNTIRNLQLHKFTHLTYKFWLRCKLCSQPFTTKSDIQEHLGSRHRIGVNESNELDYAQSNNHNWSRQSVRDDRDSFETYTFYICPQCGKKFQEKKFWRKHILNEHNFADLHVLRFAAINSRQVKCLECHKIITNAYGLQNAQQHRITHLPYKAFIRCKLCTKAYTDRKGLVKHLRSVHSIGELNDASVENSHSRYIPITEAVDHEQEPESEQATCERIDAVSHKKIKLDPHQPKEIVHYKNYVYEIVFLEESDGDENDSIVDESPVPELLLNCHLKPKSNFNCDDCGSIFANQLLLSKHIREEHDFLEGTNLPVLPSIHNINDYHASGSSSPYLRESTHEILSENVRNQCDEEPNQQNVSDEPVKFERFLCYLCPSCGEEFSSQGAWRRHINDVHGFDNRQSLNFNKIGHDTYKCTICDSIVKNSKLKALQDHKFRHLPHKLFIKCRLCGTCYNHKPNMQTHLKMRHNIDAVRNERNERSERNERNESNEHNERNETLNVSRPEKEIEMPMHMKPSGLNTAEDCISYHNAVDHPNITYYCPQCNRRYLSHVFWRKHIVEVHKFNSREGLNFRQIDQHHFLCLECYKRVTVTHTKGAIGQLQSHKFRHLPYKSFKCTKCNTEFVRKQMFFKHLNKQTDTCDGISSTKGNSHSNGISVQQHADANSGDLLLKTVSMDVPNNADERKNDADAVTVPENMYFTLLCPQCGICFDSWRPWREHINTEHNLGKREYLKLKKLKRNVHECIECGDRINSNKLRDLQAHKFKHLKYVNYLQCKLCDAGYHYVASMKKHLNEQHGNIIQKADANARVRCVEKDKSSTLTSRPEDTSNENVILS